MAKFGRQRATVTLPGKRHRIYTTLITGQKTRGKNYFAEMRDHLRKLTKHPHMKAMIHPPPNEGKFRFHGVKSGRQK